jgi:hypothetical protein
VREARCNLRCLALEESEKVLAPKPSLSSPSHAETREASGVRPSPQRSLADVQKRSCLPDVEQLVGISYLLRPQGFTQ